MRAVHLFIQGRVQGVGYRDWAVATAARLELTGWVRNRSDGGVEAFVQGAPSEVRAMIESCWQGPVLAQVSGVETKEMTPNTTFLKKFTRL